MKKLLFVFLFLTACTTVRHEEKPLDVDVATPIERSEAFIQTQLGMNRPSTELGYAEKTYNPCRFGIKTDPRCAQRYMTVVHMQLVCRNSTGSVSEMPTELRPLSSDKVIWKLGGISGITRTDSEGYGQLTMLSNRSTRGQRLILRIGHQFLGFTASDLTKVVLPDNFCS